LFQEVPLLPTPPEGAEDVQLVPSDVNTLPVVLGDTVVTAEVPLPINTPLDVWVAAPVPPWATVNAVVRPVIDVISELAPLLAALKFVLAFPAVDAPVPPDATGKAVDKTTVLENVTAPVKVVAPVNADVPVTARFPPTVKLSPSAPVC